MPNPITHNGVLCEPCTHTNVVHANNAHVVFIKATGRQVVCILECTHPIAAPAHTDPYTGRPIK